MKNYHKKLREYKEIVFSDVFRPVDGNRFDCDESLIDNWIKTKKLGIDKTMENLPEESYDSGVFSRLLPLTKQLRSAGRDFYTDVGEIFASFGAAIYCLDDLSTIYICNGDKKLLNRMKEFGFKLGSRLEEKYIGVYPANISSKTGDYSKMIGEEHPLDFFSNLCSIATVTNGELYSQNLHTEEKHLHALLIIMPLESYSDNTERLCRIMLERLLATISNDSLYMRYGRLFTLTEDISQVPTIYLDESGETVYINGCFSKEFDKRFEYCIGSPAEMVLPELADAKNALKKQLKYKFKKIEVKVKNILKSYYLESTFLREVDGSISYMKISLLSESHVDHFFKQISKADRTANYTFEKMIGSSPALTEAKRVALRASHSTSNVLITGESGTGKELMAQSIHNESPRRNMPFVAINCASIPKDLLASELFGYESGAFTGASKEGKKGKIELANGGTLFLDEIAEMPIDMQSYLLRVLEERNLYRLGSNKTVNVDVRIIAASNRNLLSYIEEDKFRLDLYYRLNVIKVAIPPLRDRAEDIEELVLYYADKFAAEEGREIVRISDEVMTLLKRHSWPGNVRELRNVLEYAINMAEGEEITPAHLPPEIKQLPFLEKREEQKIPPKESIEEIWSGDYSSYEKQQIKKLMIQFKGNKSRVAKELGMSRNTLNKRIEQMQSER